VFEETRKVSVKIRYRHKEVDAILTRQGSDMGRVTFHQPQYAVTPGQAAVFYNGTKVLGSAIIQ
jgi:tRNA-specific 2-thiouridylase